MRNAAITPLRTTTLLEAFKLDPKSAEAHIHAANALVAVLDALTSGYCNRGAHGCRSSRTSSSCSRHLLLTSDAAARTSADRMIRRAPLHLQTRLQLVALYERT
ncbi:MAG: hypothetical protein QM764_17775 [Chitinophagaceae bacterium]